MSRANVLIGISMVWLANAGAALAESQPAATRSLPLEFSLAFGNLQRSTGDAVDIMTRGNRALVMSSEELGEIESLAYFASVRSEGQLWMRGVYSDSAQEATATSDTGMGLPLENTVIGVLGAVTATGVVTRDTSILSLDTLVPALEADGLTLHVGAKYAHLTDTTAATIQGSVFTTTGAFDASSSFGGPMVALEYRLGAPAETEGFAVSGFASLALLASMHEQTMELVTNNVRAATAGDFSYSTAAELGVTASYAFTPQASIEVRAQAMHYSDVASSLQAVGASRLSPEQTTVVLDEAWYSGFSVAGKVRF